MADNKNPQVSESPDMTSARRAFDKMGTGGTLDALSPSGRMAFASLGALDESDPRYPAAKRAAEDAVRDAKMAGVTPTAIIESKDHAVRNQAPTGTHGETSGNPVHTIAPTLEDLAKAESKATKANPPTPPTKADEKK